MALTIPGANTGGSGTIGTGDLLTQFYDLISGVSGKDINRAKEAASLADPFASQRGQYQQQLQGLLTDPSSFKTDPGYQFALGQGQEGISRASNALYGTQRTGHLAPELAKFTEGYANQAYSDRINQLMQLSGANTGSPAAAGQLLAGGFANQDKSLAGGAAGVGTLIDLLMQGAGAGSGGMLGYIKSLLSGGGGGGGGLPTLIPPGSTTDASGNVFDQSGNQIGTMGQNGQMVPNYPTQGGINIGGTDPSLDPTLGSPGMGEYQPDLSGLGGDGGIDLNSIVGSYDIGLG